MAHETFHDVEACVFDAYGTLIDFNSAVAARGARLGEAADAFSELWRRKQIDYSWLRTLMAHYTDFWHVTGEALDHALAAHGIDDPEFRADLMQLYLELEAFPDAKPCLEEVKAAGLGSAILSNGTPSMLTAVINANELSPLLDHVLSVDAVEVFKPSPRVYQMAVDEFDVPASRICFVSGNGWDIAGAVAFGFRAVWLNRAGATAETLPFRPLAELRSLSDLPALLAA